MERIFQYLNQPLENLLIAMIILIILFNRSIIARCLDVTWNVIFHVDVFAAGDLFTHCILSDI